MAPDPGTSDRSPVPSSLRDAVCSELAGQFADRPLDGVVVARAPGRINLLGEHTDYSQGFVLPAATGQATWVAAAPRGDGRFRVWSAAFGEGDEFHLANLGTPGGRRHWGGYVRGVVWALQTAGMDLTGCDLAIVGDVPIGAGVASSASLEVAVALAVLAGGGQSVAPAQLALLCQRAENEFVGVHCGILDQFATVFGRRSSALLIDCRSREISPIPLGGAGEGVAFVVCDTRKPRGLVQSEYNARREQCEAAARALGVGALRDATSEDLARLRHRLDEQAYRRARHVVTENERTLAGAAALVRGDFAHLGELLKATHRSLRDDYEVSCPELDAMADIAGATVGCLGARLMGAGFGGSVLAVVAQPQLGDFRRRVEAAYVARTGLAGRTVVTWPADGAALAGG